MPTSQAPSKSPSAPPAPVLRETRFDLATAFLIALVLGLAGLLVWLTAVWLTNRPPEVDSVVPVELVERPGGVEDGAIEETLKVESPEDISDDPSLAEFESDETEVQEMLDNVLELSDKANNQAQEQLEQDLRNAGTPGSAAGTGRRALGSGAGEAGIPREQRWFIAFASEGTLDQYAAQLDFFGIELGALLPDGKLIYLSNLKAAQPTARTVTSGAEEKRMYLTWSGGTLRLGDIQLFDRAGVDVTGGILFHFYPAATEQMLAKLELEAAGRPVAQIRRTYFIVRRKSPGYEFVVTRQIFF